MFRIYVDVAKKASKYALRAWPVAFSVLLYGALWLLGARFLGGSLVGGFLLGFLAAACFSSYLTLLDGAVAGKKAAWADLTRGFGAKFWDVISVMFALWLLSLVTGILTGSAGPRADAIGAMVGLCIALFFNAVPEFLYLGSSRSFALLMDSARFMTRNWMAWFFPNVIFALLLLLPLGLVRVQHPGDAVLLFSRVFSLDGPVTLFVTTPWVFKPVLLLFLHFVMVYRGLLFHELVHSNPRLRAFRAAQR